MLVLVSSISKTFGVSRTIVQLPLVLSALLVLGTCQNVEAQNGTSQKSIFVSSSPTNPTLSGGASGSASVDDSFARKSFSGNTTLTARPQKRQSSAASMKFTDGPKPPSQMLTPEGPTEDIYTRPKGPIFPNDLRGGSSATGTETRAQALVGGSDVQGTQAAAQQAWQNQKFAPPMGKFEAPKIENFNSQPPADSNSMMVNQSSRSNRAGNGTRRGGGDQPSEFSKIGNPNLGNRNQQNVMAPTQSVRAPSSMMDSSSISSVRLADGGSGNSLGGVQPTGFAQPVPENKLTTTLAKSLMERYSIDNVTEALPGEPVKLVDMFRQPNDLSKRQPMVHHYWETYYDWATYLSAQRYSQWLEQLPNVADHSERGLLESAKIVAKNRILASEIQLGKSQSRLLQYMPGRNSQSLPLPEDTPLIQKYKTNYEAYKSNGMLPKSLHGIDQILPKTLRLIAMRADAVEVAMSAAKQAATGMQTRQASLATTLEAGHLWRSAEQDLIASVTSYNQAIADYALNVARGNYPAEKMAEMLLGKPKVQSLQAAIGGKGAQQVSSQGQTQQKQRVANAANRFKFNQPTSNPAQGGGQNSIYNRQQNPSPQPSGNFGPAALPKSQTNLGPPPVTSGEFRAPAIAAPTTAPGIGAQNTGNGFGAPSNFSGSNNGKNGFGPLPGSGR